jgi:hypothetical protein
MLATESWSHRLPRANARVLHTGITKGPRKKKFEDGRWMSDTVRRERNRQWRIAEEQSYQAQLRTLDEANRSRREAALNQQARMMSSSSVQRAKESSDRQNAQPTEQQQVGRNTQLAATLAESDTSDLVTEVHIPPDPYGIIPPNHPAMAILGNSSLVIQRQIEMMNIMLGFEQANRYIIMNGQGQTLGYIAERDHGIGSAIARQAFRTHRSFTTHIFDAQEREVLRIHRPFAYINSRIRIYDPIPEGGYTETTSSTALQGTSASSAMNQGAVAQVSPLKLDEMRIIGEAQQQWAPLRRKYNLFTYRPLEPPPENEQTARIGSGEKPTSETTALAESKAPDQAIEAGMAQFAHVNEPFLSWDFTLRDESGNTIGNVNRNFVGFAREIFTDTGVYALRMDSAAQMSSLENPDGSEVARYEREATAMTLDQRAVMLATAVSIDFDYFSRHSHAGGHGFMPIFWPMGGGAAEGGAAGAGAGAAGGAAAGEASAAGVGTAVGAAEGASTAAGAVGGAAARGATGIGAATESGIAGAGTMAGYEAMQRGIYGDRSGGGPVDDASPQSQPMEDPYDSGFPGENLGAEQRNQAENTPGNDDVWGEGEDPWSGGSSGGGGGSGGGEGGGSWIDTITDFFNN